MGMMGADDGTRGKLGTIDEDKGIENPYIIM
jgi:hypothetical protein